MEGSRLGAGASLPDGVRTQWREEGRASLGKLERSASPVDIIMSQLGGADTNNPDLGDELTTHEKWGFGLLKTYGACRSPAAD